MTIFIAYLSGFYHCSQRPENRGYHNSLARTGAAWYTMDGRTGYDITMSYTSGPNIWIQVRSGSLQDQRSTYFKGFLFYICSLYNTFDRPVCYGIWLNVGIWAIIIFIQLFIKNDNYGTVLVCKLTRVMCLLVQWHLAKRSIYFLFARFRGAW